MVKTKPSSLGFIAPAPFSPGSISLGRLLGAKSVGDLLMWGLPAFANVVVDALAVLGVEDMQRPITLYRVWSLIRALWESGWVGIWLDIYVF